jgi:hypothetical protein
MAITATAVAGASRVEGNKRVRVYTLVFSGNYATGGEAFTPGTFGLRRIFFLRTDSVARASDNATGIPLGIDYANSKFVFFEGSAAGTALSEKTNSEAYPTGCTLRVEAVGY